MFIDSNMMHTNHMLERALDTESLRRKTIANNIANVDVPHFKRSEVNFESELKRVLEHNKKQDTEIEGRVTDGRHIPFYEEKDVRGVRPRTHLDYSTTYRNDGNNVDIEKEMVDASKNMMSYNSYVTGLNQNYKILKMVMRPVS